MNLNQNASATKKGPGRFHKQGTKKQARKRRTGAPAGFVQHTNPQRNARRARIAVVGRRQYLRAVKRESRALKAEFTAAAAARSAA